MHMQDGCRFYDFHQNLQNVRTDIAHFQVQISTSGNARECVTALIPSPRSLILTNDGQIWCCPAAAAPAVGDIKARCVHNL